MSPRKRNSTKATIPSAALPPDHSPLWANGGAAVRIYMETLDSLLSTALPASICYDIAVEVAEYFSQLKERS